MYDKYLQLVISCQYRCLFVDHMHACEGRQSLYKYQNYRPCEYLLPRQDGVASVMKENMTDSANILPHSLICINGYFSL